VHRNQRAGAKRDGLGGGRRIQVHRDRVDVGEHRCGAGVNDDVGRGTEGERRRHHLVAGADAAGQQREMQRRGARVHGDGMRRPDIRREGLLELPDARTGGQPSRLERRDDLGYFVTAQVGRCERNRSLTS
jgi:hypothetical protein